MAKVEITQELSGIMQCTYAEAVVKLHSFWRQQFPEDGIIIARTVALIFERDTKIVLADIRRGMVQ